MSSENVARVEVTKVPTPSRGADTMAGSVNMISRSAFESARADFKYQLNLTGDDEHVSLKKKPMGLKKDMHYLRPSMSFAYTNPVSENFGYVITGMFQSRWTPQDIFNTGHNYNSASFGSSIETPLTTAANSELPQFDTHYPGELWRPGRAGRRAHLQPGRKIRPC